MHPCHRSVEQVRGTGDLMRQDLQRRERRHIRRWTSRIGIGALLGPVMRRRRAEMVPPRRRDHDRATLACGSSV